MSDDIDTRVTPALHPQNIQEVDGYDEDTAGILGMTETAFSEAYVRLGEVHTAREKARTNPAWTEAQQVLVTDDFAQKQFGIIARHFDRAAANLKTIADATEAELAAPVENKASSFISGEIRRHTKELPDEKRMAFVMEAIRDGDARTAQAILGAPAYLSGLTRNMQVELTRMFNEHHEPLKAKRLMAARSALELIGKRSPLVFREIEKSVGAPAAKVAKLRAARTEAEKAFVLREG